MINKKGTLVLRDVMFMMMVVSVIFVLTSFFVGEMANNYQNTEMADEWSQSGINVSGNSMFYDTSDDITLVGTELSNNETGIWQMISSVANSLDGLGNALVMVLTAPNTIGGVVSSILQNAGAPLIISNVVKYFIVIIFWIIIIFTIISAFLRGGKL